MRNRNFCADFSCLTLDYRGAAPGQHAAQFCRAMTLRCGLRRHARRVCTNLRMPTFLQRVELPERCSLHQVLLWVAFQRLPGYGVEEGESFLTEEETRRAGIPNDPQWVAVLEDRSTLPASYYDNFPIKNDLEPELRNKFELEREQASRFEAECEVWKRQYLRAIEYPASRIYVSLRDGSLKAQGRQLRGPTIREALDRKRTMGTCSTFRSRT